MYLAVSDTTSTYTRPRFSDAQVVFLEQLFHTNTHPTLEERQRLAIHTDMEVNSVTSWFQNKRKSTSRRRTRTQDIASTTKKSTSTTTRRSSKSSASSRASSTPTSSTSTSTSASRRPSLDRVASRSELRVMAPRTPSRRRHDPRAPLWANMASSPTAPPSSPFARDYVEFGQGHSTPTLEWACARRRLTGVNEEDVDALPELLEDSGDTDVEVDEARTPPASCDSSWTGNVKGEKSVKGKKNLTSKGGEPDDEMMGAALALCGLMRG
ncbi:homeodomain transcription factor [Mycena polygramma]|nr:homeodomain transcription factor [Mycena polygramma]KAJ7660977.1 homeodomain transcription factor [Mycena polygramma]